MCVRVRASHLDSGGFEGWLVVDDGEALVRPPAHDGEAAHRAVVRRAALPDYVPLQATGN